MTSNIHLRGVDHMMLKRLKEEAKTRSLSVNQLILIFLRRDLGLSNQCVKVLHHDLDKFAGTWSKEEGEQFMQSIDDFNKIDKGIWQ